ncbi:MAG: ATP-dependent DNA ligase [Hyphomicrobium sp. 32-62-53]|nr:MAG: ATP-dependent DNA ligase [Hyphomicrobium sp. 12-62-95]OYY01523.1 MAG: ATP-dependent DNA ligase [Hyphomicrobium sp. 32-62-53]
MRAFAETLDSLSTTQSRNGKLALLTAYLRAAPDPDRGWALAALTDGLPLRIAFRRILSDLMAARTDPVLFKLSRDFVGDTAETVALLWPTPADPVTPPRISEVVDWLLNAKPSEHAVIIASVLDRCSVRERWAFLKLVGGAPRVGVSARLAKTAVAEIGGQDVSAIEEVWHALKPPYTELFAWMEGSSERPDPGSVPVFRPLMLAHPVEDADWPSLDPLDFAAEWKWDGIRVQVSAKSGEVRVYSRTGDDISPAFPEIRSAFAHTDVVADGELLVVRENTVAPFNDLQQRLNRKSVTSKMLRESPAHLRLYDLLFAHGEDIRALSFEARRERLESWHAEDRPLLTDLSALVPFTTFAELEEYWRGAREAGIEGLMLKRRASPYLAGRPKGHWFKWKRAALTLDCVLMYAQRGSGKRSSLYSDLTFGVWRTRDGANERELVPVGKAYSGFTDVELRDLDRFIRANTTETFGPVRAVTPKLVLEVAFDAVQPSTRHKSGVAMRFPRIHRIRWDKPADEADTLDATLAMIDRPAA